MPKISVIMPVYNGEQYLREAIESILNQTYSDFEFIIINDFSMDSTEDIIKSYTDKRIVYIKNEQNMGVANTLNRGLDIAKGEYIARMDADDISLPSRFEKQVSYMDTHKDIDVLATQVFTFGAKEFNHPTSVNHDSLKVDMLFNTCLCHPTVMLRGSVFGKNGIRYDNAFNKLEDYELWARICNTHKIACYDEILFKYRLHENQVTQNYNDEFVVQYIELKNRILSDLEIDNNTIGFNEFINHFLNKSSNTEHENKILREFYYLIHKKNMIHKVYNQKILDNSLRGLIYSTLKDKKERKQYFKLHRDLFSKDIKGIYQFINIMMRG